MKTTLLSIGFASGLIAVACSNVDSGVKHSATTHATPPSMSGPTSDEDDDDDGDEEDIAIAELPSAVKNTALAAVPGLVLNKAEKETAKGQVIYSIEGTANGEEYCVEVATDGTLIGVEQEDADDDDEDGD